MTQLAAITHEEFATKALKQTKGHPLCFDIYSPCRYTLPSIKIA